MIVLPVLDWFLRYPTYPVFVFLLLFVFSLLFMLMRRERF